jgi:hypothetical protein
VVVLATARDVVVASLVFVPSTEAQAAISNDNTAPNRRIEYHKPISSNHNATRPLPDRVEVPQL